MATIAFTHTTTHGVEHRHELPACFEVCPSCQGEGTHLHPAIGQHAYSADEFNETFHDDEDRAQYFKRGGIYDIECDECHGSRVVLVADESEATRTLRGRRLFALYLAIVDRDADYAAERANERRMGY